MDFLIAGLTKMRSTSSWLAASRMNSSCFQVKFELTLFPSFDTTSRKEVVPRLFFGRRPNFRERSTSSPDWWLACPFLIGPPWLAERSPTCTDPMPFLCASAESVSIKRIRVGSP